MQTESCINCYHKAIAGALKEGNSVTFVGFGTFKTVKRQARAGRNPKTGQMISIPKKRIPKFIAGSALKETVK